MKPIQHAEDEKQRVIEVASKCHPRGIVWGRARTCRCRRDGCYCPGMIKDRGRWSRGVALGGPANRGTIGTRRIGTPSPSPSSTHTYARMHVRSHAHTRTHTHTVRTHTRTHTHTHTHTPYTHTHRTHAHTHILTHLHTHTYTH